MKTPCLERTVDQHGNCRCSVKVRLAVHHDDVNGLFQAVHEDPLANGQSHGIGVKQGFDTLIKVDPSLLLKTLAKSPSNGRLERSPLAGACSCHRCASIAGRGPGSCAQSPGQLWLKLNWIEWMGVHKIDKQIKSEVRKMINNFDSKRAFRALAPGPNWSTGPSSQGMLKERPLGTWPPCRWSWPGSDKHGSVIDAKKKNLYQSSQGAEALARGNFGLAAHEIITWAQCRKKSQSQINSTNFFQNSSYANFKQILATRGHPLWPQAVDNHFNVR